MLLEIAFFFVIFVLFGIVIGSFLNVCIYRIPKKESIVTVGSHCMKCGKRLKWYDLIPVVSFLFLRGKCRYCGSGLSWQYPAVELLNGAVYGVLFLFYGLGVECILYCLLASTLIVLSVIDYRTLQIPVGLNAFILGIGLIHLALDYENYILYLVGFFSVSLFLFLCLLITRGRGIGGGDIKLMAAAGLSIGFPDVLFALVAGCIIGSVIQIIKMIVTGEGRKFAFGPYLSLGIFVAMLWSDTFFDWYLGLLM